MPSLQLDLGGGQLKKTVFKGTHEWLGYCRKHLYSLYIVAFMMLIHPCHDLSDVIVDTKQDEDKSNFYLLLGSRIYG